jgi:hypothetical protein
MKAKALALAAGFFLGVNAAALDLADNHPDTYTVVKGDTLWDIAGVFLDQPWQWPEIWVANDQIENPHLIYPGDVLRLVYRDGKPVLEVVRTIKMSPEVRVVQSAAPVTTIPLEHIEAFLQGAQIFQDEASFLANPYMIQGAQQNLIVGQGQQVFARGESGWAAAAHHYGVYRGGNTMIDPITEEILGFEALEIGAVSVLDEGDDIARLEVTRSRMEMRPADRVVELNQEDLTPLYYPAAPEADIDALILAVDGGVSQVGNMSVVTVNKGAREGLEPGNVLAIWKAGEVVRDPVTGDAIQLPEQYAGVLMIFKPFDKMSYALVLEADRPLKVGDFVRTP